MIGIFAFMCIVWFVVYISKGYVAADRELVVYLQTCEKDREKIEADLWASAIRWKEN